MDCQPCKHLESCKSNNSGKDYYRIISACFVASLSNGARKRKASDMHCFECNSMGGRIHACMSCVYFGCFELGHLKRHALKYNHDIGVDLHSGNTFCFKCNDYTYDDGFAAISRRNKSNVGKINEIEPYFSWEPTREEIETLNNNGGIKRIREASLVGLRGLLNIGNSCYMNCIFQILLHISLLRNYFLSDLHRCHRKQCVGCEMSDLFQEFYSGFMLPYHPTKVIHQYWNVSKHLAVTEQGDAHEFFLDFLNVLHTHCSVDTSSNGDVKNTSNNADVKDTSSNASQCKCIIHQIFYGVMQNDMVCTECRDVSTTCAPFSDMSLDLTNINETVGKDPYYLKHINIEDCIQKYVSNEIVDSSCSQCDSKTRMKQFMIKKLPIVACLHLKRLNHENNKGSKNSTRVEFPEILDMSPFMSSTYSSKNCPVNGVYPTFRYNSENKYVLIGVVNHEGNATGGHYFSYIRQLRNNWYKCDDVFVGKTNFENVLNSEGYILFYHKQTLEYGTDTVHSNPPPL